jgi:drug/metabolite transporter (DMT)-like permease
MSALKQLHAHFFLRAAMSRLVKCSLLLVICGMMWGLLPALSRFAGIEQKGIAGAVSLSLWVNIMGAVATLGYAAARGKLRLPNFREAVFLFNWAILFSLMNQVLIYWVSQHLSVSVVSTITVLEGFVVFAAASALRMEVLSWPRLGGILLGAIGVIWLMASEIAEHEVLPFFWMAVALVIPLTYAAESLLIARRPESLCSVLSVGFVMLTSVPMLLAANCVHIGPEAFALPDPDLLAAAFPIVLANLAANLCYLALISAGGAVFAAQSSNFITLFGVMWGIVLVGEKVTGNLVLSLVLILAGLAFVGVNAKAEA